MFGGNNRGAGTDPGIVVPPRLEPLGEGHAEGGVVGVVVHQVVVAAPVSGAEVVVVGVVQVTRGIPAQSSWLAKVIVIEITWNT